MILLGLNNNGSWTSEVQYQGSSQPLVTTTAPSPHESSSGGALGGTTWDVAVQGGSLAVIGLLALVGNFIVTFSLVRRDQLHLPSNRLVFNLTASNFAFALLVLPFVVASVAEQKWLFGIFWCNFTAFLTLLNGSASVLTLAMIAIDRYYAIVKPMAYTLTITSSKSTAMLLWVWIQACACSLPPLFNWSRFEYLEGQSTCLVVWWDNRYYTAYLLTSSAFLPFCVMLTCYYFIFQVAQKKSRKITIGTLHDVLETEDTNQLQMNVEKSWLSCKRPSNAKWHWMAMTKGAGTICVVIGAFIVTWLPQCVLAVWESACGHHCTPRWLAVSSTWLMYASSVSYPVVYGLYNRAIRKEMVSWLYHPNVNNAFKGLPSRNSRRGSFTNSLLDFSPFRIRFPIKKTAVNLKSRASIDLGTFALSTLRKGSQDSGTVMSESDVDNTHSGFWSRRRHSASNVLRFQSQAAQLFHLKKREAVLSADSCALPILRIITISDADAGQDSVAGDIIIHSFEHDVNPEVSPGKTGFERQKRGASVDEGIVNDFLPEDGV